MYEFAYARTLEAIAMGETVERTREYLRRRVLVAAVFRACFAQRSLDHG